MSSSPTETLVDVTMPQMGVSVAEGTVVEWKKQVGDWVQADEIIASISTDKIDTDVEAPATGRVQEVIVDVGTTVDVGTVLARIATDAKPGEPHVAESAGADSVAESAGAAAATRRARRRARGGTRRSSCGWPPSTGSTSRRSRAPAAAGACASRTCWRSWRTAPRRPPRSRRCTSRARTGRTSRRRRRRASRASRRPPAAVRGAGRHRAAVADAAVDRLPHAAVAADRGDVHDRRRGRPDPDRGGPRARPASRTCRTSRARRSRRCASSRRSTPRSRTTR